jgi:hypothetical protein
MKLGGRSRGFRKESVMSRPWQGEERRSHPRLAIEGAVEGALDSVVEAPIVDLSVSGALVELSSGLPSGGRCLLRIPVDDGEATLDVSGEVVRSYVHGFDKDRQGQPSVRYRAAIRFVDVTAEQSERLDAFIKSDAGGAARAAKLH